MYDWIAELGEEQRILDVASGPGSFPALQITCKATLLDEDTAAFDTAGPLLPGYSRVFGRSDELPVRSQCIDLVVCNHALEHVAALDVTLREISRVLKPNGRLFVSVPHGYGLCDRIYRFLFEGGGHVNRFRRDDLIRVVENVCGLHMVRWQNLYSSFVELYRLAELLRVPPAGLCGRLAWMSKLPCGWLIPFQRVLYSLTRRLDRLFDSELSLYGWAFYFERSVAQAARTSGFVNVCLHCDVGSPAARLERPTKGTFRCPSCSFVNPFFEPHRPNDL
jgi:SAM-dependent methyltransferase